MSIENDPLAVPWFPESLRAAVSQHVPGQDATAALVDLRDNWRYVLIEEVAGGAAELHSWPWPLVDQTGRLAWTDTEAHGAEVVVVPSGELQQRLYAPELLRQPRAGDTFAVRQSSQSARRSGEDALDAVLAGQIVDITPDARYAAKVSYYGSSAAIFHEDPTVSTLLQEAAQQREERTAVELTMTEPPPAQES